MADSTQERLCGWALSSQYTESKDIVSETTSMLVAHVLGEGNDEWQIQAVEGFFKIRLLKCNKDLQTGWVINA